jgi:hypothetical protein
LPNLKKSGSLVEKNQADGCTEELHDYNNTAKGEENGEGGS